MEHTRRKVLTGIGATLAIGIGAPQAFGQESEAPEFKVLEVSATDEYVTFLNTSTETVDLSGWTIDFEYGSGGTDQQGTIPDGTSVGPREPIKVASGAGETDGAVVIEDPYDEKVIDTDGNDVIALLDADGNEVANSEDDMVGSGGSGGGDDDTGGETTTTTDETTSDDGTDQSDGGESSDTTENGSNGSDDEESGESSDDSGSSSGTDESSDDDC
jgi:predicted extracellular nuclease